VAGCFMQYLGRKNAVSHVCAKSKYFNKRRPVTASPRLDRVLAFAQAIRIARPALCIWIYVGLHPN
jgi:hypothetical protein